ncbi:carboxylating nicotinate-nucleotide diphosphorylase [Desulfurobacterium indicum]|uniref:Probable nicotinate-nucleotide pyrophosphorylase [carboxylating] n=1 Tax=Desulfurobacterium indicum TaxID=1914305 RepID=A0A1R1MLZ5_9BACT|nr:carboxylating nicotinate-nucleotide diphosphorylase [Desulfurobacterium indicum]OMH40831.1 nicotinate-nucleotide diphosphorylase (carboxylating) [Desulfurobacterium indicum]
MQFSKIAIEDYILSFLKEDIGFTGDITSSSLPGKRIKAYIEAKENFILAGSPFFQKTFEMLDKSFEFIWKKNEGNRVAKGEIIAYIEGNEKALLTGERTALNLIQHLSGIATNTRKYVEILNGTNIKLLDTRKTTPGLRYFEKYATKVGGAYNHRMGLYDAVMIKDNHIKAFGSVETAVLEISKNIPVTMSIEVEIENWQQLEEAIKVKELINIIMLDNWSLQEIDRAVKFIRKNFNHVEIEISGGITLETLKMLRNKDIDYVSTSKLITRAKWVDISMEVE